MMEDLELSLLRKGTTAFIAVKPTDITLVPRTRDKTPSGGYAFRDGTPRGAQTFRIIELGMQSQPPVVRLSDGSQREVNFWLLGEYDSIMEPDDWWQSADDRVWIIGDVVRENGYEQRGLVVERGR